MCTSAYNTLATYIHTTINALILFRIIAQSPIFWFNLLQAIVQVPFVHLILQFHSIARNICFAYIEPLPYWTMVLLVISFDILQKPQNQRKRNKCCIWRGFPSAYIISAFAYLFFNFALSTMYFASEFTLVHVILTPYGGASAHPFAHMKANNGVMHGELQFAMIRLICRMDANAIWPFYKSSVQ